MCVPVNSGCVCFILCVWSLSVWPKTPGCLSGEIRAGMEKQEFARHLFSFTGDLNYVLLAAAGEQAGKPLLSVMLSSTQQTDPHFVFHQILKELITFIS